jgi:hypothetical protein
MRPLLALMMPTHFSVAAQYTNDPIMVDLEWHPIHKHVRTPSDSTRGLATRTPTVDPITSRLPMPRAPRPTLSRTTSSSFPLMSSRPCTSSQRGTPLHSSQPSHSRSGSNISMDIASAEAQTNRARFPSYINPLRISAISPPTASRFSSRPPGLESYDGELSDASGKTTPTPRRPQTPISTKPLPITPLPVSTAG